jgi:hypothetical protein
MSEENKCNGLDCVICAETKCPNEEKEKNIDGIDVCECSYYNKDNEPYCCEVWDNECEAQNCYFKQFKRLQEENEKLKNKNNDLIEEIASGNIDIAILQKENEELKKKQITKNGFICDCEQNAKYKQALEEIREITEQDRNCMNSELACCRLCDKLDLIKEKTKEVLNDRN